MPWPERADPAASLHSPRRAALAPRRSETSGRMRSSVPCAMLTDSRAMRIIDAHRHLRHARDPERTRVAGPGPRVTFSRLSRASSRPGPRRRPSAWPTFGSASSPFRKVSQTGLPMTNCCRPKMWLVMALALSSWPRTSADEVGHPVRLVGVPFRVDRTCRAATGPDGRSRCPRSSPSRSAGRRSAP